MITNTGKTIIAKYLLGQAPAYASYIAIGCGATPLTTGDPIADYSTKTNLDFEMFRVPISSRGFVNENGLDKIVLTAELPTEERYEISEVGIYSAGSNPSAGAFDSKTVFAFTQTENWQHHTASSAVAIDTFSSALDQPEYDNIIAITDTVFQTSADNPIFFKSPRVERYERPRFLNNIIMIQGDDSDISISEESGAAQDHFVIEPGSNHIHLTGASVDFTRNSPTDELRLAFSVINKDGTSNDIPERVRVLVEFASTETETAEYARFEAEVVNDSSGGAYDFDTERYFVVTKQLQDLYTSANFTWNAVTVVKIYACVFAEESGPIGIPSPNYYVALDALRLENIATVNPLYGLTGYSVIQTQDASTIVKNPNTSNYIEFRFSVDVSGGVIS
jgi:hypothetical protein